MLLVGATTSGFVLGRMGRHEPAPSSSAYTQGSRTLKSGPWGEIEVIPMSIAAPTELLPIRRWETDPTHWIFKGYSKDDLARLLSGNEFTSTEREVLLGPAVAHMIPTGVDMTPPREIVLGLGAAGRQKLYEALVRFPENLDNVVVFDAKSMEEHLRDCGVSAETVALFKKLCAPSGKHLLFSSFSCLLPEISKFEEKVRFVKAVTCQDTLLLRLHVTPESDVNTLSEYWGKGQWATNVKAIL
jgi:hypothetical protein